MPGAGYESQPGRRLASTGEDGTKALGVSYRGDGKRLATAWADGTVRVWDPESGAEVQSFHAHPGAVHDVVYSPDGKLLATSGGDDDSGLGDDDDDDRDLQLDNDSGCAVTPGTTGAPWTVLGVGLMTALLGLLRRRRDD